MIIENIGDKIDIQNIFKEAFQSFKIKLNQKGADKKTLTYNMRRINAFSDRVSKQHIINFKIGD